jgi:AraC-like DNA-binding protein
MKHSVPVISMVDKKEHSLQFEIQSMEYIGEHRQNRIEKPHKHDYFVIIWIKQARGKHTVDFHEHSIEHNSICFITPGQIHHIDIDGIPNGYVISFHHDFFCISENQQDILMNTGLFYNCSQFRSFSVSPEQAARLEAIAVMMQEESMSGQYMQYESLRGLLKLFLIHASRFWGRPCDTVPIQSKPALLTRKFMNLLETNFKQKTKVNEYAEMLVVTPNHLNDTIKSTTGFPASEHIKNRVILEAKRLAYLKDFSAKQVALELGFDDEAHFSKYFKNNAGITFTEFRKTNANK